MVDEYSLGPGAGTSNVQSLSVRFNRAGRIPSLALPLATMTSKQALRMRLYAALLLLDLVCIAAAFGSSNFIRFGVPWHSQGLDQFMLLYPIYVLLVANGHGYGLNALKNPRTAIRAAFQSLIVAAAILIGIFFYLKVSVHFSRQVLAVGLVLSAVLLVLFRWNFARLVGHLTNGRFTNEVLLIDGAPVHPSSGEIVIIADGNSATRKDPLTLHRIGTFLYNADCVILAASSERRNSWVAALKGVGVDVEVLTPELDSLGPLELRRYEDHTTLVVGLKPLGLADSIKKRILDLCVSVTALVLLAPVFAALAILIKLDSPGPVFFRQPRVGEGNRIFQILKFRTMRTDAEDGAGIRSTQRGDDRVTRLGRLLRRTSLDEIPQLINVLAGDMSMVGPRPHALESKAEEVLFWEIEGRYWERHGIKPGITGLAQVRGFRGTTATKADVINRVQSDLEYLVGWSLWRDVLILLRTARVLIHPNAY
ncbi:MAG TPA: sugar transferase [Sphingomicrobium sp.]|nr:sugar transferase [Sphingomicrobium sp.]